MLPRSFPSVAVAVAIAISSTRAEPTFFTVRDLLVGRDCKLPAKYEIRNFGAWTPADGNQDNEVINFNFTDPSTTLTTLCHKNSTSEKVVPVEGLATRYACENSAVEFIWTPTKGAPNGTLTVIETACPEESPDPDSRREAAGSIVVAMACTKTTTESSTGEGSQCFGIANVLSGQYFSLQPRPHPPKTGGRK